MNPFDLLLDAALAELHRLIDWRCAENLLRCKDEAEFARRSIGQRLRWVTT